MKGSWVGMVWFEQAIQSQLTAEELAKA